MGEEIVGPFRFLAELGSGGMGTVHLAVVEREAPGLARGDRVAVKVFHTHLAANPVFRERFRREARAGRRVRHENVVRTIDGGEALADGGTVHYLVTEYVEGRTLRGLLTDLGVVPEALLREIAGQIAAGLTSIHAAELVHRDLKPENILITRDHRVRIMDLGVARFSDVSVDLTAEGEFAGSLYYAAPEQFGHGPVGPPSDLYALGVLLYELATGANPFRRDSLPETVAAHLREVPPTLAERNAEVSPFFSAVVAALLRKDPGERFADGEELAEVLAEAEDGAWWSEREEAALDAAGRRSEVPVRRETRFLGREAELARLREAWSRARAGEGALVLLEGEAGIGKSRLVDEFLRDVGEEARVLYGSYPPSGGLGALTDAVVGNLGSVDLASKLSPHLGPASALAPAFAAALENTVAPQGAPALSGDALHAVFCRLAQGLAAARPLVWVVEDLHFADPDGRKLLFSMARATVGHPILLLGTTRPGLPQEEAAVLGLLPGLVRIDLRRLDDAQVAELLREAFGSDRLAERIGPLVSRKSDGVPFFVFELIRAIREEPFVDSLQDGAWSDTGWIDRIEVPSSVRDLVAARLAGLSDEDRDILDAASVAGFEFDPDLLARVLEVRRIHVLQRLAAVERKSGVVRTGGRHPRFDHHQIQEVLYGALMPDLRQEYHALLADALAEREGIGARAPGEVPGDVARFVAEHRLRSSRPAQAIPLLPRALDHLEGAYRHEAALVLSGLALEVPGLLTGRERVDLLLRRASPLDMLGRRAEEESVLEDALRGADELGEPALRATVRTRLGWLLNCRAETTEARTWLEEAVHIAAGAGALLEEGAAAGTLGLSFLVRSEYEEALSRFFRALDLARAVDDHRGELNALGNAGIALARLERYEEAERLTREQLELARARGARLSQSNALLTLGFIAMCQVDREEAVRRNEESLALSREIGHRQGECWTTGNLGNTLRDLGRLEEAQANLLRSREIAREIDDPLSGGNADGNLGEVRRLIGDLDGARADHEQALAAHSRIGFRQATGFSLRGLAAVAETAGDLEAARRGYEETLAFHRESGEPGAAPARVALARVLAALGRNEEARQGLREAIARAGEEDDPRGRGHAASLLATLGGDVAAAVRAFAEGERALVHDERMEARFALWRATGDPEHLEAAHELLVYLVEHAPADRREAMVEKVPLHQAVAAAWRERTDGRDAAGVPDPRSGHP